MQGLYGGSIDKDNPTETEHTASETRLQLRMENYSDKGEMFGRLDFVYDGAVEPEYKWELREGYMKFKLGSNLDLKIGRQILTWGTGDLVFINDVFAKDYRSFFVGRDDQYLKAPQNAFRAEYYSSLGNFSLVWTPRFEANRLPYGEKLSYYMSPMPDGSNGYTTGMFAGTGLSDQFYFEPPKPEATFGNSEFAFRFQRQVSSFNAALYAYKGFYKSPTCFDFSIMSPVYPRLSIYGASIRGALMGGILWLEGGYFGSRDDRDGDNPAMPNSSMSGMIGFERQIATDLTANVQWKADYMLDYVIFTSQQIPGVHVRDEIKHLLTSRVTKKLNSETISLNGFIFFSPNEEDLYLRLSVDYKYTDEISLTGGANIFDGSYGNTDFGQFALNDNVYAKLTYGF